MFRTLLLSAAISTALAAAALPPPVHAQASASETRSTLADNTPESRALHALFDAEWERGMRESPETASYRGDHRFNDRWSDLSLEALRARQAADRAALEKLRAIDRDALSEADRLSYDVFAWQLERSVERQKYNEWQRPLSQRGGIQTAEGIAEVLPFRDADDYRDWIKRLEAIPTLVEQTTGLMREGLAAGNTPPRVLMERVPGQIESQLVDDPTESPFYKPFTRMPDSIPASERQALQSSAQKAIRESVIPAYRDFNTFFNDEYLPGTRETIAAADMPIPTQIVETSQRTCCMTS